MLCLVPRLRSALLGALLVLSATPAPRAQSPGMEAAMRATQARSAARRGELREAVSLYDEAVRSQRVPSWVYREYAELLERMGRRRESASQWNRYAAEAPTERERQDAQDHAELLRITAGLLRVRVSPPEAAREARVWFDRDPPVVLPVGGAESFVPGGPHRVRVEAPGFAPWEQTVSTAYGEQQEVRVRMSPAAAGDGGAR